MLCQIVPWQLDYAKQYNLKLTYRRAACLVNRVLGNMGVEGKTPLLERFGVPAQQGAEKRWLEGLYLDAPEEWDDPYRFFGW